MAAAMSDYLRQALLNHLFRDTPFTPPATIALALCTGPVLDTDTGDLTGKEVTGGGYDRVSIGRGDAIWTDGIVTMNVGPIVFPTATGNWSGPIGYLAIVDNTDIGSGNLLFYGTLTQPKTITVDDMFVLNASQLSVALT